MLVCMPVSGLMQYDWIKVGHRLRFTFCLVSISYFRYFAALRMIWLNDSVTSGLPIDLTT